MCFTRCRERIAVSHPLLLKENKGQRTQSTSAAQLKVTASPCRMTQKFEIDTKLRGILEVMMGPTPPPYIHPQQMGQLTRIFLERMTSWTRSLKLINLSRMYYQKLPNTAGQATSIDLV